MKACITGASSGIGRDMARVLADYGIDLFIVARRSERLKQLAAELSQKVKVCTVTLDLADEQSCRLLYERLAKEDIDILINNAGFGTAGLFIEGELSEELQMIDTNIKACHILTKLFLRDFVQRDFGYILNVASASAFLPGPRMAVYYATKTYVHHFTLALRKEMQKQHSHVFISSLCPGPVHTEFNEIAGVKFRIKGKSSYEVAKTAVDGMFAQRAVIIPGKLMKAAHICCKLLPTAILLEAAYHIQKCKQREDNA